ncbi:U-box domain-containing protein 34-like [Salvia divinorum]|uniref:RING-type E3 ubiquitin transferase n=1 Tax=Salvia divinorum TaxID=28513 RepID=A0ABD1HRQ7_SALDI
MAISPTKGASTVVAVDRDKNSQHALQWAVDNLRLKEKMIVLVHVTTIQPESEDSACVHSEMQQLFLPFRVVCARKGVRTKEVILRNQDIAAALSDFLSAHSIKNIVVGASSRGAIARAFRNGDVATFVGKLAPHFCSVYSVSKAKVNRIKSPTDSAPAHRDENTEYEPSSPSEMSIASTAPSPAYSMTSSHDSTPPIRAKALERLPAGNLSHCSTNHDSYPSNISYEFLDEPDASSKLETDLEEELNRVKLELKQIKEKYNAACLTKEKDIAEEAPLAMPRREKVVDALDRCRRYSGDEIEAATNNFSSHKIGQGSYGPVYRATIDHTPVAIKILKSQIPDALNQFHQEVDVLTRLRHPNMVILMGACPQYGCLVYEYMENGSLEDRLFCKDGSPPLPCLTRFSIAVEIATGLNFLHQTRPQPLVHRDLKPGNILLDRNYVSKISDVGLSRLIPAAEADNMTQYRMTAAAGTFCYIDPEYQQTGLLGTKSDVYSLGIILLQIITARPPMGLTHLVDTAIQNRRFAEILDPRVQDWPVQEALELAKLALQCSELRRRDRPDLASVVLPELVRLMNVASRRTYYFTHAHQETSPPSHQSRGIAKLKGGRMRNTTEG